MEEKVKDENIKEETEKQKKKEKSQTSEKAKEKLEDKPLDKMTAPELREIAKQIPGISGVHALKKAELLAAIHEFRGIKDEAPVKTKKKKKETAKSTRGPKELKLEIAQLKTERQKAREAQDKNRVKILRRRINRMKKKTRKAAQA